jgi:hypothetical protein
MPLPEKLVERESFEARTGIIVSDTKCRVCVDSDVELLALRAKRTAAKRQKV